MSNTGRRPLPNIAGSFVLLAASKLPQSLPLCRSYLVSLPTYVFWYLITMYGLLLTRKHKEIFLEFTSSLIF